MKDVEYMENLDFNEGCRVYGESRFCRGRERECILYTTWEKKMIRNSRYVQDASCGGDDE